MPITNDLRVLMTDSVTIEPRSTQDVNNQTGFGASATYTCRCEGEIMKVKDPQGNERVSTAQVYLDRLVSTITEKDRITLPTRFLTRQPPIIRVRHHVDDDGDDGELAHTIIYT